MVQVVRPTLERMRELGTPFAGLLYVGLALTAAGPRVVEFNARFGDPETEVVLPLLEGPFARVLLAAATGTLAAVSYTHLDVYKRQRWVRCAGRRCWPSTGCG